MENLIAWLLMAGISLPLSFVIARGCLRGLVRLMSWRHQRGSQARCAMIAGVKGSAVCSALLILLPWSARAADDMAGAIGELARKTIAFAGRGEPVSLSWRNVSTHAAGRFHPVQDGLRSGLARGRHPGQRDRPHPGRQDHRFRQYHAISCWWKKRARATTARCGSPPGSAAGGQRAGGPIAPEEEAAAGAGGADPGPGGRRTVDRGPGDAGADAVEGPVADRGRRAIAAAGACRVPGRAICAGICGSAGEASRRTCRESRAPARWSPP